MSSFLKLITAAENKAVSFEEAAEHLRLDEIERATVEQLIALAEQHIAGRDGWLGRELVNQTWKLTLDEFPCDKITLPLSPLQEVESITYIDTNGDEQELAEDDDYTIIESEPAQIIPAYGKCWPSTRCYPGAVKVTFKAGYGPDGDTIPAPIKQAILLLIGHFYENREIIVTGATVAQIPYAVDALLNPYRLSW